MYAIHRGTPTFRQNSRKHSQCVPLPILVLLKAVYIGTLLQGAEHLWSSAVSDSWIGKTAVGFLSGLLCVFHVVHSKFS